MATVKLELDDIEALENALKALFDLGKIQHRLDMYDYYQLTPIYEAQKNIELILERHK